MPFEIVESRPWPQPCPSQASSSSSPDTPASTRDIKAPLLSQEGGQPLPDSWYMQTQELPCSMQELALLPCVLHAWGCSGQVETTATRSLPPRWHHQRPPRTPLPSKSFLKGSNYHSNKLRAVHARPYLRLTQNEPSPLCACGAWSIYFLGKKKIGSHSVILSSRFPHSIAFRSDFQMVLEKKKPLDAQPSCPARLVARRVEEQRGKMGFVPHVRKQGGWIQLAEWRRLILQTRMGC